MGVECVVVENKEWEGDMLIERTYGWFAQDDKGTVWYFGEGTKEYENGEVVSTEGSWEAGVDGAKPGMIMPASPAVGDEWRQEYYACHAEDEARLVSQGNSVTVPAGTFTECRKTRETTRLEPNKRIAWNSIEGDVKTSGQVTFNDLGKGETEVTVTFQYTPPAGAAGELVARALENPETLIDESVRAFKSYAEKNLAAVGK